MPAFREETQHEKKIFGYRTILLKNIMMERRVKDRDMKLTREMLEEMASVDIRDVDINQLTDLREIKVDTKKPVLQKLESFAEQTNNVYIHRIGDYIVKVRFMEEGPTIDDKMEEYLRRLAQIHI